MMTTEQVIRRNRELTDALEQIMELSYKLPFQGSEDEKLIY